jgi:glycosyltransferase involved in cell wall biosynthesis
VVKVYVQVEAIDLNYPQSGGVESLVLDLLESDTLKWGLLGVKRGDKTHLGLSPNLFKGLKAMDFEWNAISDFSKKTKLPDSLHLILGLIRNRRCIDKNNVFVAHRVEVGCLLRFLRLSYVLCIHNDSKGLLSQTSESVWRRLPWLFRILESISSKGARGVFVFNAREALEINRYNSRTFGLMSWFDESVFRVPDQRLQQKVPTSRVMNLVWVGRLESQKNPLLALEIAKLLATQKIAFRLDLVGSGSLMPLILDYVSNHQLGESVVVHGSKTRKEIAEILSVSDCLLVTSYSEGSSVVIPEAASMGVPAIVQENADIDGFIEDGKNGFRVGAHKPEDYLEKLRLLGDISRLMTWQKAQTRSKKVLIPEFETMLKNISG